VFEILVGMLNGHLKSNFAGTFVFDSWLEWCVLLNTRRRACMHNHIHLSGCNT